MDLPYLAQPAHVFSPLITAYVGIIVRVSDILVKDTLTAAGAQKLDKLCRRDHVLLDTLAHRDGGAGCPAEEHRLDERRVGARGVRRAYGRQEPCRVATSADLLYTLAHHLKMRPTGEDGVGARPRVRMYDKNGKVDVFVEWTRRLAAIRRMISRLDGHAGS